MNNYHIKLIIKIFKTIQVISVYKKDSEHKNHSTVSLITHWILVVLTEYIIESTQNTKIADVKLDTRQKSDCTCIIVPPHIESIPIDKQGVNNFV